MNKKLQQQYCAYLRSEMYDIFDVYKTPSNAKLEAWNKCLDLCKRNGGYNIRVAANNCQFFSVGYLSRISGYTTFTYITKNNIRTVTL